MFVYQYPHPAVTTDCVIFGLEDGLLKVLLVERGDEPCKGCWAFPGGFLNPAATVEQGALRELQEETGLDSAYMEQVGVFSDPDRDPRERVITVAFFSVMHVKNVRAGDDAAKAKWLPVSDLPELAFDHDMILKTAIKRFRERLVIEPDFLRKMPDSFSEKEMENVKNGISLHY